MNGQARQRSGVAEEGPHADELAPALAALSSSLHAAANGKEPCLTLSRMDRLLLIRFAEANVDTRLASKSYEAGHRRLQSLYIAHALATLDYPSRPSPFRRGALSSAYLSHQAFIHRSA